MTGRADLLASGAWVLLLPVCASVGGAAGCAELPVTLAIEFHLENATDPVGEVAMVEEAAGFGAAAEFPLTFGVFQTFLEHTGATEAIEGALGAGHAVTLHASLPPGDAEAAAEALADQQSLLATLDGTNPEVVSGVCTDQAGWLEAALAAGVTLGVAPVEFCQLSLDPGGAEAEAWAAADADMCAARGPSGCHAPAPTTGDPAFRLAPWQSASSDTWTADEGRGLRLVSAWAATPVDCTAPGEDAPDCASGTQDDADADVAGILALIDAARAEVGPETEATFYLSWSTSRLASSDYLEAWFSAMGEHVSAGEIRPITLPGLAEG